MFGTIYQYRIFNLFSYLFPAIAVATFSSVFAGHGPIGAEDIVFYLSTNPPDPIEHLRAIEHFHQSQTISMLANDNNASPTEIFIQSLDRTSNHYEAIASRASELHSLGYSRSRAIAESWEEFLDTNSH